MIVRKNRQIEGIRSTRPESPIRMIFNFTSTIRMNKHAVSTSVLNHPLHHRFYFFRKYEYRPVGYWEWTSRAVVGIKHAGVIIVEEIMAIWPKSLVELGHKLITDVVSILNLFLT